MASEKASPELLEILRIVRSSENRFTSLENQFSALDLKIKGVEERLRTIEQRLDLIERRLASIERYMDPAHADLPSSVPRTSKQRASVAH